MQNIKVPHSKLPENSQIFYLAKKNNSPVDVYLYDAANIDQMQWPDTQEGRFAKTYLLPFFKEGPEIFIQNAKTQLCILKLDQTLIPLTINQSEYENSYLLSSFFVAAHINEKIEKKSSPFKQLSKGGAFLFSSLLKWMHINKVVIINNWLLSTNPYPELTQTQIQAITLLLKKRFPNHYFMFRSINTYKSRVVYEALKDSHYKIIPCRNIFLYDPNLRPQLSSSVIRKQRKDKNLLERKKYSIETVSSLTQEESVHLLRLYHNVYVAKYTRYSPMYTEKYLCHALQSKIMTLKLLKKEGYIFGAVGLIEKNGYLLVPFFGYDTSVPQEEGLYRMLSAIIMQEIEKREIISHQGSGASQFKKWRGYQSLPEYVAIYDEHLPILRRAFWSLSEKMTPLFQSQETSNDELDD